MAFKKATKSQARLRLALIGPPGSGKTFTALRIARGLVGPSGRIALADSERGSASKYADRFEFDTQDMESFAPKDYCSVISEAEKAGYAALVIDSLSHAWMGKGGALEMVDQVAKQSKSKNSFDAWRSVTPEHNAMVDAILRARLHVIVTMRVKTEYVVEEVNGKKTPRKVGLAPVQRDGLEYEFDVVADMDGAELVVTKTRCPDLAKAVVREPGEELGQKLRAWLTDGTPAAAAVHTFPPKEAPEVHPSTLAPPEQKRPAAPSDAPAEAKKRELPEVPSGQIGFDPWKGRKIAEMTADELGRAITDGSGKIATWPTAFWAGWLQRQVDALKAEQEKRQAELSSRASTQVNDDDVPF